MKVLLIVGGVLFLLLAAALFIGAVVLVVMARRRRGAPSVTSSSPAVSPDVKPRTPLSFDPHATVMVNMRAPQVGALHATSGPLAGRAFAIDTTGFFIGRDQTVSQVVIDSPDVSKRHVWIGVRDGAVLAIDQQSTNGTSLNVPGNVIREARLSPGDTIIIANDAARFTYRAD